MGIFSDSGESEKSLRVTPDEKCAPNYNIDELLNCTENDIENSVFFASNIQLLSIMDSSIRAIDSRLARKKTLRSARVAVV